MKKILLLLLISPFFLACSSDDEDGVDLNKYPLYGTKWVSQSNPTSYDIFKKENGISYATIFIEGKEFKSEKEFTYKYEDQNVSLFYRNPKDTIQGFIKKDTLYFKVIPDPFTNDTVIVKYVKAEN